MKRLEIVNTVYGNLVITNSMTGDLLYLLMILAICTVMLQAEWLTKVAENGWYCF